MLKRNQTALRPRAITRCASSTSSHDAVLDVTVVLLEGGYASTAIGPIEVFHSAGLLWNWLHGAAPHPRFRLQIASINGAGVSPPCFLRLAPGLWVRDATS